MQWIESTPLVSLSSTRPSTSRRKRHRGSYFLSDRDVPVEAELLAKSGSLSGSRAVRRLLLVQLTHYLGVAGACGSCSRLRSVRHRTEPAGGDLSVSEIPVYQCLSCDSGEALRLFLALTMPPGADEHDGNTLVPLKQFGSASETEIVLGLLRSSGIPAVHAGQYNPRAPDQILVPAKCVADAYRLIGDVTQRSIPSADQFADEPRSVLTAISWLLASGVLMVIGLYFLRRLGW